MIASVRGKAQGDSTRRRRASIWIVTAVLAAAAFALGASSAMAATVDPTAVTIDPAAATTVPPLDATQVPVDPAATTPPAPADPAATTLPPPVDPASTTLPPPVAPASTTLPPPADPAATTLPPPVAPANPTPDQLSPDLLAQVNGAAANSAVPSKSSADIPPAIKPTRTAADAPNPAAKPATPPPSGDVPPGALLGARKTVPHLAALVPSLVPVAPASSAPVAAAPRREAAVTRAGPVWHQFIWRDAGAGGDSTNLGTRALLAMIGILPFAPVDGPDRTVPPSSQLALLIPVLALAAFLFATRPIAEPRRRAPHRYRAVALKPG